MEESTSSETNICLNISHFLCYLKVHYYVHKTLPEAPIPI